MSISNPRILIMAGGTGGHVFPGLAVANFLRDQKWQVAWLGTKQGLEATLVKEANYPLYTISIAGFRKKGMWKQIFIPFRLLWALLQSMQVLHRFKPHVVLGMGGYVAAPSGLAAKLLGYPLVIHEQNAIAGLTNRLLAHVAKRVLEGFPHSFPKKINSLWVGNPVRNNLLTLPSPRIRFQHKTTTTPLHILIMGGSRGAQYLNQLCPKALSLVSPKPAPIEIWHQTGNLEEGIKVREAYSNVQVKARVEPFIDDMQEAYLWADIVIARAGASTVSELAIVGVGSILIPFPFAVDNHQTHNGRFLEQIGAAWLFDQSSLDETKLSNLISRLVQDRSQILLMAENARRLAKPEAVQTVANVCKEVAYESKRT